MRETKKEILLAVSGRLLGVSLPQRGGPGAAMGPAEAAGREPWRGYIVYIYIYISISLSIYIYI